ncbi:hypothetical protein GTQ55_14265 [Microbulbifer hydrolyticus]|uniref:Uncharacterized protein n=2 Tax=Microbulbifer hydrolyticus TaxID=48074 RepID=A0A6P1TDX5_9GAMM|nr:hypothetical protein [Microbulbifer hydrolyticus]MBB5212395.1 hypothetical protein [Microbulbifer hydrolyticus]QHQ40031.1 hypothetical protein GTQ55_14265 [Microbulbifer hydrolyticus]
MIENLFTLERSIPESVAMGVLSGKYSIHGGVIRDVGGRIVRHLVPAASTALNPMGLISAPFDIFNTFQLRDIAKTTQQLVGMSQATMALSGLNLAVSAVGFAVLYNSLKKVDERVKAIDKKVSWIKIFLESERRATLLLAADELSSLPDDTAHRTHILHSSRERLGHASMHYREHLESADDLMEAMAYQHFFCTAFLMRARCSAELGMFDNAVRELNAGTTDWLKEGQRIAKGMILGDGPERFLQKDYVEILPSAKLAEWMDFAHAENRGIAWIDTLRSNYSESSVARIKGLFSSGLDEGEKEQVVFMHNLVARSSVLEGYKSQYECFLENKITPSAFYKGIDGLTKESSVDGMYILAPTEAMAAASRAQETALES